MSPSSYIPPHPVFKAPAVAALIACCQKMDLISLRQEPKLFSSRWPLHKGDPHTLTFKFAQAYQAVFKEKFRESVDAKRASGVRGLDLAKFTTMNDRRDRSGAVVSLNRARQVADTSGLPYEIFLRFCFDFWGRRKCKVLPGPHQLVPASVSKFEPSFNRELAALVSSELPVLTSKYRAQYPQTPPGDKPSCIGVIGARDVESAICQSCPHFVKCGKVCEKLAAVMFKMETDSGKPVALAEKRRAQAAARQAARRAKVKAEKLH